MAPDDIELADPGERASSIEFALSIDGKHAVIALVGSDGRRLAAPMTREEFARLVVAAHAALGEMRDG